MNSQLESRVVYAGGLFLHLHVDRNQFETKARKGVGKGLRLLYYLSRGVSALLAVSTTYLLLYSGNESWLPIIKSQ
jgi:hypothetical protein